MKTTADLLATTSKYIVFYETERIDIFSTIDSIMHSFRNGQLHKFTSTIHKFSFYKDNRVIKAHVKIVYEHGIINIFIVHLSIGCDECEGKGTVWGTCSECGQETQLDCEECDGSGQFCTLDDAKYYDDFNIQKEVLYKTIDLNQGELF